MYDDLASSSRNTCLSLPGFMVVSVCHYSQFCCSFLYFGEKSGLNIWKYGKIDQLTKGVAVSGRWKMNRGYGKEKTE